MPMTAGGCQQLESLFIRNCSNVSQNGVNLAMNFLRNLKVLDHELPLPQNDRNIQRPTASLISLMCNQRNVVKLTCTLPLTTDVLSSKQVQANFVTDTHLTAVAEVMNLKPEPDNLLNLITFEVGVVNFLTRFGTPLTTLELLNLHRVDVLFIFRTCCRLQNLALFQIASFQSNTFPNPTTHPLLVLHGSNEPPVARNLETFRLVGNLGSEEANCRDILSIVLMAPNLRVLEIENCTHLVDTILLDALSQQGFERLESLTLINCNELTKDVFVHVFLTQTKNLKYLKLVRCTHLCTVSNRDEWMSIAKRFNWDLRIEITIQS